MNETNIKHGYSLMVFETRGAILNPGAQILKTGAEFMPPEAQIQGRYFESRGANFKSRGRIYATRGAILKSGAQYWGPQGLDFFNYVSPGLYSTVRAVMRRNIMHCAHIIFFTLMRRNI